jgi:hypothetical protein
MTWSFLGVAFNLLGHVAQDRREPLDVGLVGKLGREAVAVLPVEDYQEGALC